MIAHLENSTFGRIKKVELGVIRSLSDGGRRKNKLVRGQSQITHARAQSEIKHIRINLPKWADGNVIPPPKAFCATHHHEPPYFGRPSAVAWQQQS